MLSQRPRRSECCTAMRPILEFYFHQGCQLYVESGLVPVSYSNYSRMLGKHSDSNPSISAFAIGAHCQFRHCTYLMIDNSHTHNWLLKLYHCLPKDLVRIGSSTYHENTRPVVEEGANVSGRSDQNLIPGP